MRSATHSPSAKLLLFPVFTLAVLFALGVTAKAQRVIDGRDLSGAERDIRVLESAAGNKKRDAQTIMTEVNDDFARLRVINEEIKNAASSNTPLNFKAISDNGLEIKKRGARLRTNLAALPKAEKEDKQKETVPTDEAQLKSLLLSVNTTLTRFLNNPVFSDMGTLDNQLALRARVDLEYVINLSDLVKTGADKLARQKH
ncbi:MAG TPA: hypothetical protein VJT71_00970 [Pyrinomonadaceae bacterium]|nr:hypothetical protein [Pyrinomonadaceae bacterium]